MDTPRKVKRPNAGNHEAHTVIAEYGDYLWVLPSHGRIPWSSPASGWVDVEETEEMDNTPVYASVCFVPEADTGEITTWVTRVTHKSWDDADRYSRTMFRWSGEDTVLRPTIRTVVMFPNAATHKEFADRVSPIV